MQLSKIFILFFLSFLFSSLVYGKEPIRIGVLTSAPESTAPSLLPYRQGAEMAVAEVNAREGKKGLQILLFLQGGDFTKGKDLKRLHDLIYEERFQFLIGEVVKEAIPQVSRIAQQQRIPFLAFPTDFIEAVSTAGEPANLFWISPAPEAYQRAAVRMVAQLPKQRYFLISRDSAFGRGFAKYFREEVKRLKPDAQPIGEFLIPGKVEDYNPYIQAILSAKAEVCLSHLGVKEWLRFVRTAKKQGYFRQIIHFELESGNLESLVALKRETPEGILGVSAFPFWDLGWKETQEFVKKYRKRTKAYPVLSALGGYVSVYALVEAMQKAGSGDLEKIIGTLEELSYRTPVGMLGIRKADHRALWPLWVGSTRFTADYPFAVLGELNALGPDSFSP